MKSSSPIRTMAGCSRPGTTGCAAKASCSSKSPSRSRRRAGIPRGVVPQGDHPADQGDRGYPHHQSYRPDLPGAPDRSWRGRGTSRSSSTAPTPPHFPFNRDQLESDYYGTSLHKWLLAPVGTGFLYVRKERIKGIWPLMGGPRPTYNIRNTRTSVPIRRPTTTPSGRRSPSTAPSARPQVARLRTSATAGPSSFSPRIPAYPS